MSSVHCKGEENCMRMLPIVFQSIISSHRIFWFSLEITLACHYGRGWSTTKWEEREKEWKDSCPATCHWPGSDHACLYMRWNWFITIPVPCNLERRSSRTPGSYHCAVLQPLCFGSRHFPILFQCLWSWMCFLAPSIHLVSSLRAQVKC